LQSVGYTMPLSKYTLFKEHMAKVHSSFSSPIITGV